ncbi:phosphate ABC transporter substrate-binding protein [Azospirillum sp. SYSU D00513]|uniref:phosphate ABC transporter substrate-binding protein n=1 Tax=Azospirillum sp. SYSU D00513 TaxID=2812561 RepID=UPI001A96E5B7|nr:phosphate ABC transporter substrate-binding protein [Azospirillum sp. SYSU D00513]
MSVGRRLLLVAGGGAVAFLLGGATTNWDLGQEQRVSLLIAGSEEFLSYASALSDAFARENPRTDMVLEGGGTAPGLIAVRRGAIDVAMASREPSRAEEDKLTRSYLVARDAVALIVNPTNPVQNVSKRQAAALFEGKAAGWAELGWSEAGAKGDTDGAVRVYRRKEGSDVQKALEKLVLDNGDMTPNAVLLESGAAMIERVAADPAGAGYATLADVTAAQARGAQVKVLAVDGVPITRATILSGRYPLTRSFYCVLQGDKRPQARAFLAFAQSRAGQDALESMGLIAVR